MFLSSKPDQYSKASKLILLALDVSTALLVFSQAKNILGNTFPFSTTDTYTFGFVWLLLWITVSIFINGYEVDQHRTLNRIISNTFKIAFFHLPFVGGIAFLIGFNGLAFSDLISLYGLFISMIILVKSTLLLTYRFIRNLEKYRNKAVIIGYTPAGVSFYQYLISEKAFGYTFAGFFDKDKTNPLVLGDMRMLKKFCVRENIDEIFYALPYDKALIQDISSFADDNYIRFAVLQDIGSKELSTIRSEVYDNGLSVFSLREPRRNRVNQDRPYQRALSIIKNMNL